MPEVTLAQAELNARALWGGLNQPGGAGAAHRSLNVHERSVTITERL